MTVRNVFSEGSILGYLVESKGAVEYTPKSIISCRILKMSDENFVTRAI